MNGRAVADADRQLPREEGLDRRQVFNLSFVFLDGLRNYDFDSFKGCEFADLRCKAGVANGLSNFRSNVLLIFVIVLVRTCVS